ncbi:ABC transporter permease [Halobacterium noricense]|uniref:ABC transporter permease n=1 Tax=Halobacterium noricense TaxID=223182 RepID=UPI001E56A1D9|nr:ABC transporter permease [Halobacterium noricense]UHH25189.1 ABC transporter permease [Halobacterium noricense]
MQSETEQVDSTLVQRIRQNPTPAVRWAAVMAALVLAELGALAGVVMAVPWDVPVNAIASTVPVLGDIFASIASVFAAAGDAVANLPTLLSREWIPNQGYFVPGEGWQNTFMGLEPKHAWLLRVGLVYAYAFAFLYWMWRGYLVFRRHYRYADWTPADDIVDRFRGHTWGQFGLVLVVVFLVMAAFAPTVSPVTQEKNIMQPYGHEVTYFDSDSGSVETVTVGAANLNSQSAGTQGNVGPWTYDSYDRFHPAGTLPSGKDLFTFLAYGARISLFIGIVASGIAGGIALGLALLTSYYKGLADMTAVVMSDAFSAMPRLLVLIMLIYVLQDHWIMDVYSGAFLLALLFGIWGWMGLWRSIRGPSLQIVENEWITAAEGFGEKPRRIVTKHVAPYVFSYLLIYLSMSLGGYIISAAGLAYLGLGVTAPTPEWGRAISVGQSLIQTQSWHVSVLPGVAITLLVLGFNAFGDGVRDALDPKAGGEGDAAGEAAAAGGGA